MNAITVRRFAAERAKRGTVDSVTQVGLRESRKGGAGIMKPRGESALRQRRIFAKVLFDCADMPSEPA